MDATGATILSILSIYYGFTALTIAPSFASPTFCESYFKSYYYCFISDSNFISCFISLGTSSCTILTLGGCYVY